ncbi:MAG TPA: lanthionine synthetase LanC family protein [Streptosporangiaceae bacterium]
MSQVLAVAVAERLLQPETVLAAVPGPEAASLAHGLAGTALLHARLATVDRVFGAAAESHWATAARCARKHRAVGAGIFATGGGLAASLIIGTGYLPGPAARQASAGRAAAWLSRQAQRIAGDLADRRAAGDPYSRWAAYDVINGLAGIGRVLLAAVTAGQPAAEPGLTAALRALTTMIEAPHGTRPGWWLPASIHPPTVKTARSGSAATGMAHGIAGPLAFLAAAHARGRAVPDQDTAIRHAAQWLLDWKATGTHQWPASVTGAELDAHVARLAGRQDAWCYGTPGISAALALASQALDDHKLAQASQEAIASLAIRAARTWDADGPTICHGHAGVLQCAVLRQPAVASAAARAIAAAFDASRRFAIPHTENGATEDRPGFLTGAAGTALALALAEHGHLPSPAVPTRWDSILLLS